MPLLHPPFIHFPIALIVLSVILDLIGYLTNSGALRAAGWWSLFGGAVGGVIAAATGLWDMYHVPMGAAESYVDFHMWLGFALLGGAAVLAIWRGFLYSRRRALNVPYMITGFFILGLVLLQGWVGGQLVYSYGVGVAPTGQSNETPGQAQEHLKYLEKYLGPFEVSHEHQHLSPDADHHHDHGASEHEPR